jgi:phosphate starvation-inducible protein PhoH and related proteins
MTDDQFLFPDAEIDPYSASDDEKKTERNRRRRQKKLLNYQHKIKTVVPKTPNQEDLFHSFYQGRNILLHGSAGSGKSYCALYLALRDLFEGHYERIVILRSIVPTRDIGFLPGTLSEKLSTYEEPYAELIDDLLGRKGAYNDLKKDEVLQFKSTSFLRGINYLNTLVIADEIQNCTWHEICSVITRIGEGSRILLLGDREQSDLGQLKRAEQSGLDNAISVCNGMRQFDVIHFAVSDVLRSELVREFLTVKRALNL